MYNVIVASPAVDSQQSATFGAIMPSTKRAFVDITDRNTDQDVYRLTQQLTFFSASDTVFRVNVSWQNQALVNFDVPALNGSNRGAKIELTMTRIGIPFYKGGNDLFQRVAFAVSLDFGSAVRHLTSDELEVQNLGFLDLFTTVRYAPNESGSATIGYRDTIWERLPILVA